MIQMTGIANGKPTALEAAFEVRVVDDENLDGEGNPVLVKTVEVSFVGYGMFKIVEKPAIVKDGDRCSKIYTGNSRERQANVRNALTALGLLDSKPELEAEVQDFLQQYLGPIPEPN